MDFTRSANKEASGAVAVVYPYLPHYRMPVFRALSTAGVRSYRFFAGSNTIDTSIKSEEPGEDSNFQYVPTYTLYGLTFQFGLWRAVCLSPKYRHVIFLGDPHFVTTWIYAALGRIAGKKIWFWTHGWLRPETGAKGSVRRLFYKLSHGLLLYGERAKKIGVQNGFVPSKLHVIYNSLDYDRQRRVRERLHVEASNQQLSADSPTWLRELPYFACVARLTDLCRFDLAIQSLARLQNEERIDVGMVLIGTGPEGERLQAMARDLGVRCWFPGALYDENAIGHLLHNARAVVSPGKIGLTAMHSLAYGTPVISHDDFSRQMPEFEAIVPGKTGDFFSAGNSDDLTRVMLRWLNKPRDEAERRACIACIEERYTPRRQWELIEMALRSQD